MKLNKDLIIGLALGICVPVVGYALVMIIFEQLINMGIMSDVSSGYGIIKRNRTMGVLAIAFNLIPFHHFKNKRKESSMRGVLIPTFIYAATWIVYYWDSIMN